MVVLYIDLVQMPTGEIRCWSSHWGILLDFLLFCPN